MSQVVTGFDAPFVSGVNLSRRLSRAWSAPASGPRATVAATPTTPPPTPTPNLLGNAWHGVYGSSTSAFPSFTGSAADYQGCPGGEAPAPVTWGVHSAGGYGATVRDTVALTFDDGPTPASSLPIITYLEQTHTPATFFVMGQFARAYPWIIQREAADGFTIGVHTWSHPDMRLLTPDERAWQLAATIEQLHADLGAHYCLWLWRPPYGASTASIVSQAGTFGLTTIIWNDDPRDWSRPGTETIVQRVLSQVHPGSIILMHDGPAYRQETAAALPDILAGLRARGLTPVSLPDLLRGYQPPAPRGAAPSTPYAAYAAPIAMRAQADRWDQNVDVK